MANKTIEFRYSVYNSDDSPMEPSDVTYSLPITDEVTFAELQKHFRRFLKSLDIK